MAKTTFNPRDDFQIAASLGLFDGVDGFADFAQQLNVPTDVPTIVGGTGTVPTLPPDTGEPVELFSAAAGNAGAVIALEVLDENFEVRAVQNVAITGVGAFPILDATSGLPVQVTRVNRAVNVGPRGGGELIGPVTVRSVATPANIFGTITAASQELQQAIRTIPAGYTAVITSLVASMRKSTGVDTDIDLALYGASVGNVFREVFTFGLQRSGATSITFINVANGPTVGPADLYLTAIASAADADLAARLTATLVKTE